MKKISRKKVSKVHQIEVSAKVVWWMKLSERLSQMQERAQDMARGACTDGKFYWLGRFDALREVHMELEPLALSEDKSENKN